ncbi:MAG: DUF2339 domain-containing protein, partial [Planctomycetes bacterium]|nr:DUF2339 domain-containing protein [Planctomycetota bacterium]
PAEPPLPAAAPEAKFDYERFFGLAVLGRIGIAALMLAGGYFAQLGWGHLGPAARVAVLYLVAATMVGIGAWLRPRTAPRYIALLWGGATSLSYLAGVAARLHYELIEPFPALVLLVASAGLGQFLARKLQLQAMATVALAGAYAAPLLIGADSASPTGLFVYLLALHTWSAVTEERWQWRVPRGLAVVATTVLALGWFAGHAAPPPLTTLLHVEAIWLGLATPELLRALTRGAAAAGRWRLLVVSGWTVQLGLLLWTLSRDALPGFAAIAGAGFVALAAALLQQRPQLEVRAAQLSRLGGCVLVLGAFVVWNALGHQYALDVFARGFDHAAWRVPAIVATGLLLLALRRFTGAADLAAGLATALGLAVISLPTQPGQGHLLAAAVLLLPIGLVLRGADESGRKAGLLLGAAVTFVAVRLQETLAPGAQFWFPIAAGASGLWLALVGAYADRRADRPLAELVGRMLIGSHLLLALCTAAVLGEVFDRAAVAAIPFEGLVTGPMALLGGAALVRWAPSLRDRAAALADFGVLLLAIGALTVWSQFGRDDLVPVTFDHPWFRLLSLTGVTTLALTLRRHLGGGELGALGAALVGLLLTTLPMPSAELRGQTAVLLTIPAALVLTSRAGWLRSASLALGAAALFFASTHEVSFDGDAGTWLSIAFGASGAWAALGALRASWRRDRTLLMTAITLLVVLGVTWSVAALQPVPADTEALAAFFNLRFASALVVIGLLEFGRRRLPADADAVERISFTSIEFAIVYLAGLVEVLALVRTWPDGWSAVTVSLYSMLFAGALLAAGFVRQQSWLRWPGLGGLGLVVVKVMLFDLRDLSTPLRVLATGALGLVLLVSAFAYARLRKPSEPQPPTGDA